MDENPARVDELGDGDNDDDNHLGVVDFGGGEAGQWWAALCLLLF